MLIDEAMSGIHESVLSRDEVFDADVRPPWCALWRPNTGLAGLSKPAGPSGPPRPLLSCFLSSPSPFQELVKLADLTSGDLEVGTDGDLVYNFPLGFRRILRSRSLTQVGRHHGYDWRVNRRVAVWVHWLLYAAPNNLESAAEYRYWFPCAVH
jgi:hypothetical protein